MASLPPKADLTGDPETSDALFRLIVERRSLVDDVDRQILHCLVFNDLECAVRRVAAVYASCTRREGTCLPSGSSINPPSTT
jgi:hypothetical protein